MSTPFSAAEAARWTGGELAEGRGDAVFRAVSIDTRTCPPGALFVAIRGPRHDAHAYLDRALAAGAAGLVVERRAASASPAGALRIEVTDTTRALADLAAGHRAGFAGPLVAITGSNGKTTTKEMCAAILEQTGRCLRTRGNLNNQYGLPLTLLEREPEHRAVVVEMGTNQRGEIAALAAIARPTVGVLTNVGTAHIEFLGSREGIAQEKGDLLAALPGDGVAVVNGDDALATAQAARTRARVLRFGTGAAADVRAERAAPRGGGFDFHLRTPWGETDVHVAGLGDTAVPNALAAAAAALGAGAGLADVANGLARYEPVRGRMQRRTLARGIELIDDTYNANPQSVDAALRSLARLKGRGRAVAVLGDMGELGREAAHAHRAAGELAARLRIDFLFAIGAHAGEVAEGARSGGMAAERVVVAGSHDETAQRLRQILAERDWVLVKGSRSMRMERVVEALAGAEETR